MGKDGKRGKTLKTFNLDENVYREFSNYCKKQGISMSKRVENFIRDELIRLRGGIRVVEKEIKRTGDDVEHSFKKYC